MKKLITFLQILLVSAAFGQYTDTVTCINGTDSLSYTVNYWQQQCTDSCDGTYSINVLIGSGNYTYDVSSPLYSSSLVSDTVLCPEEYTCMVTDQVSGIACTMIFTVDSLQPFSFSLGLTNCSATGVCDGEAELTISGGNPPYDINWYDGVPSLILNENEPILDSLCAGGYYYNIEYTQPCCSDSCPPGWGLAGTGGLIPFQINEPLTVIENFVMEEFCPFMCDGMVSVSAIGGTGNYVYDIGFMTNTDGNFDWLCPGIYNIEVTDDVGNTGSIVIEIFPAIEPWPMTTWMNETCAGSCDGQIVTQDLNGTTMQFSIDYGATFNNWTGVFDNLCPGTYEVWGMNFNGCAYPMDWVTIAAGSSPVINNVVTTNPTGPGLSDGCIMTIDVTGGNPPYMYTIDGLPAILPDCTLPGGTYEVCVTDANGCTTCEFVNLIAPPPCLMTATITPTEVSCFLGCDGILELNITGATGNTTITWQDGWGSTIGSSQTMTNLCAGVYIYNIVDDSGCTFYGSYELIQPDPIVVTVQTTTQGCNYPCNGVAIATAVGGTGVFEYSLDGISWTSNNMFTDLCPDIYIMYASDELGCIEIYTFEIIEILSLSISTNVVNSYTDPAICDGEIEVTVTGGKDPYTYVWRDCETDSIVDNTDNPSALCPGTYYVEVTDNNQCSVSSLCDTIYSTLGLDGLDVVNWEVFPNPAYEEITIKTELDGEFEISIYTVSGSLIHSEMVNKSVVKYTQKELKLSEGIYFIELKQGELQARKRLVVIQ